MIRALTPTVAVINNGMTKGCDPHTFARAQGDAPPSQAIYQVHRNLRGDGSPNTDDESHRQRRKGLQGRLHQALGRPQRSELHGDRAVDGTLADVPDAITPAADKTWRAWTAGNCEFAVAATYKRN